MKRRPLGHLAVTLVGGCRREDCGVKEIPVTFHIVNGKCHHGWGSVEYSRVRMNNDRKQC